MVEHFTIDNIPFGIFSTKSDPTPRAATAYLQNIIDLSVLAKNGVFKDIEGFESHVFSQPSLNSFARLPRETRSQVRLKIQSLLKTQSTNIPTISRSQVRMHLPMQVSGFVDFLTSTDHAERAGRAFGQKDLPLNFYHLPTAYNGRASTVVVSGTEIVRPWVQSRPEKSIKTPKWSPCQALDYELEMGCFICKDSKNFEPVTMEDIDEYIFGYVLLNDWSARDVQGWESAPLGPFLGKSFATSISPWVITPEALAPAATGQVPRVHQLLPYLSPSTEKPMLDIKLSVSLRDTSGKTTVLATSNYKYLYFCFQQMFVSQTSNGCTISCGDLIGSGTISGPDEAEFGCLLEGTMGGKKVVKMEGFERMWLEDYDEVIFEGWVDAGGVKFGFGQLVGKVLPAIKK